MEPKPDNRKDNVENIQKNINHTIQNIEAGEEFIAHTDNPKQKQEVEEKNERRRQALEGMRSEIKQEAKAREEGYKK